MEYVLTKSPIASTLMLVVTFWLLTSRSVRACVHVRTVLYQTPPRFAMPHVLHVSVNNVRVSTL